MTRSAAKTLTLLASRLIGAAFCLATASAAVAQESFFDDFERLDRDRWYVSDGWTNGPHQNCWWSERAVSTRDGRLVLALEPTDDPERPYLCGEIQTDERFRFGTFEARIRTARASGVNAAFFTYIGPTHDRPHDEIDVEILTRAPERVEFNTFVSGEMRNGGAADFAVPADEAFHHVAFTWEEDRIRWYVDGDLVHEATGDVPFRHAQKLYLSHWSSDTLTDWMGAFDDVDGPLEMEVDWVAWTAPGEGCQFEESILCQDRAR